MSQQISKIRISGVTYDLVGSGGGSGATIIEVTQAEYDALVSGGTVDPDALYVITDADEIDMSDYVDKVSNFATVEFVTNITNNNTPIVESSDAVNKFYLSGGTSGYYCYLRYGYTNNGSNSCCYNTTFNWGNSFAINYGTVTYDSSANTYTVTANEGYGYYNLYVNSGTFTIYTDPYVVSGQSASVIMTAFPFVYDYLLDKVKKSEITSFSLYGGNGWLNFSWTKNNSTSTSSFQLADNTSILMDNNGKMYLPTISSTTATEFEVMTGTSCYRYFNNKHDGTTNNYDDNWNQGTNNYTFHVNSAFTSTNNQYIQVAYGYGNSKDVYNGGSNLNIYYRYSGSSIVYSLGNSYNYSNDYSGMTQTIKTNYNLNIELSATSVKYTKEDQAYSGYYYWVRQFYFNNCQYIPSYSTSFISGATYSSNDVQQKDALQTVYTAYETRIKAVKLTQLEYDAIVTKDPNVLYIIVN